MAEIHTNPEVAAAKLSIQQTQEADQELDTMLALNAVEASEEDLQTEQEETATMGFIRRKDLKTSEKPTIKSERAQRVEASVLVRKEEADSLADGFAKREGNREFRLNIRGLSRLAFDLGERINENKSFEEIINLIRTNLAEEGENPDVVQVDKTFDFLIEVAQLKLDTAIRENQSSTQIDILQNLRNHLVNAKDAHFQSASLSIETGRDLIGVSDALVEETGATTEHTLNHLREIVHNPQDAQAKVKYYESRGVGYNEMKQEFKAIFQYLGASLREKNIDNPTMNRLIGEVKTLQAVLGVFNQAMRNLNIIMSWLTTKEILR